MENPLIVKLEKTFSIPAEVGLEYAPCPMGCLSRDSYVLTGHDRLHGLAGEYDIVVCQQCGLMRTNPRPTPETIGYYYPDNYGPYQGTRIDVDESGKNFSTKKQFLKTLVKFNTECIPVIPAGRMLEIGCASGRFLQKMSSQGWQVEGIEFSQSAAEAARSLGHSVQTGCVESIPDYKEPFDLVVGWMVVEHLHQPVEVLEKLARWVKPGGWLAISMPNAGSLAFRLYKDKWHALHLPNHLYHFTPQTMEHLLEKSGWKIEKIFHQRVLSSQIESLGYVIGEKFPNSRVHKFLISFSERGVAWNIALYPLAWMLSLFGQTDGITIWARKQ